MTLFPSLSTVVNVASVPMRSPFRYPGGKTWLVPTIRRWLLNRPKQPALLVEPFAGGASVGLTAAFESLVGRVLLVELDPSVAAVWRCVLNGRAEAIAERILTFDLTIPNVKALLSAKHRKLEDVAFATLVRNRVQHGGIMSEGASLMKEGENGKGISSRWYAATLAKRIREIKGHSEKITFKQGDAFETIKEHSKDEDAVFFVDPPYTLAGKRLYRHSEIDHLALFRSLSKVKGDVLMTYDDTDEVRGWAKDCGFDVATVAMKSRQHTAKSELLIGRDLDWARV